MNTSAYKIIPPVENFVNKNAYPYPEGRSKVLTIFVHCQVRAKTSEHMHCQQVGGSWLKDSCSVRSVIGKFDSPE